MGVQFPQFADKEQGLAQGISQGLDIGQRFAQIGQMGAEKRKRDWEMGFQKAAYAMANASNPNFADETREKFLQKGVAPFLNDTRWGFRGKDDPEFQFSSADLKNEAFLGAVDKIKGLMGDKDLSEKEKMIAVKPLIIEMRTALGQDAEIATMLEKLITDEDGGKSRPRGTVRLFGRGAESGRLLEHDSGTGSTTYKDDGSPFTGQEGVLEVKPRILPAEQVKEQSGFDTLIQDADEVLTMTKNAKFIGPIVGRWNQAKSKVIDNPEFVEINSRVGQMIRTAYALSGKQISEKEIQLLRENFWGQITEPKGNFDVKMNRFKEYLTREAGIRKENYANYGYFVPSSGGGKAVKSPSLPKDVKEMTEADWANFLEGK